MTDIKLEEILLDSGIIRNRLKIYSVRKNAIVALRIQEEFGSLDAYFWNFINGKTIINRPQTMSEFVAESDISKTISQNLKKRGMSFVGSTIIYAYMQATGMVDDHVDGCWKKNI